MSRSRKSVHCPLENTLRVVGGRWKALVLRQLCIDARRFNAIQRALPGITHRTLVRQLRDLERDEIVQRRIHSAVPARVEYSLTELGRSLEPVLAAMHEWGERFARRGRSD